MGLVLESVVFDQLKRNRDRTLAVLDSVTEQQADVIPAGFNNNIRWHVGHILTTQERFALRLIGEPLGLPEELTSLFLNGTKPADWEGASPEAGPPDLSTLRRLLEEQPERLCELVQGRLEEKLTVPFKELGTLGEALIFSIGHEAAHTGYIMALKKAAAALG
jgi:uncharacterized damage-inducible protein DinB